MNQTRRNQIDKVLKQADKIETKAAFTSAIKNSLIEQITKIRDAEQEYLDNLSEAAAEGEKGDKAQEAIDQLDDCITTLEKVTPESSEGDIIEAIEDVCSALVEAQGE